jgi:hypothetical protein
MTTIEKQTGNYLKGDFVKEKGITQLKITSEPKDVQGDFGIKLECQVSYEGFNTGSPSTWTLNKKSRNALIDKLGNDTEKWIGFTVPVETAITEKGRAIYVDIPALQKLPTLA